MKVDSPVHVSTWGRGGRVDQAACEARAVDRVDGVYPTEHWRGKDYLISFVYQL